MAPLLRRDAALERFEYGRGGNEFVIKFWKKLDNPFLLVAEGFVAGAILFWAIAPDSNTNDDAAGASKPSAAAHVSPPVEQMGSL